MKRILRSISILIVVVILNGCYASTHVVGTGGKYDGNEISSYDLKKKKWYLLLGGIPLDDVSADKLKGNATNYTARETQIFGDLLIGGLTFGIATPRTIRISFAEGEGEGN